MEEGRGGHTAQAQGSQVQVSPQGQVAVGTPQAQGSQVQVSPQGQVGTTQPDMFVVLGWLGGFGGKVLWFGSCGSNR